VRTLLIDWFFTPGYPMFEYYGIEGYTYRYLEDGSLVRGVPGVTYVGKDREILLGIYHAQIDRTLGK
jgi:hypothetical protein